MLRCGQKCAEESRQRFEGQVAKQRQRRAQAPALAPRFFAGARGRPSPRSIERAASASARNRCGLSSASPGLPSREKLFAPLPSTPPLARLAPSVFSFAGSQSKKRTLREERAERLRAERREADGRGSPDAPRRPRGARSRHRGDEALREDSRMRAAGADGRRTGARPETTRKRAIEAEGRNSRSEAEAYARRAKDVVEDREEEVTRKTNRLHARSSDAFLV